MWGEVHKVNQATQFFLFYFFISSLAVHGHTNQIYFFILVCVRYVVLRRLTEEANQSLSVCVLIVLSDEAEMLVTSCLICC